jgi:hypothetical protein
VSAPYTPDTEDVRRRYVGPVSAHAEQLRRNREAAFDRWLAQVKAEAWDEAMEAVARRAILREWDGDTPLDPPLPPSPYRG